MIFHTRRKCSPKHTLNDSWQFNHHSSWVTPEGSHSTKTRRHIEAPRWPHLEFPHLKRNQTRVPFLWASYTIAYTADSEARFLSKWRFVCRLRSLASSVPELILIQLLEIEGCHVVTMKITVFGMWYVAVWYIGISLSFLRRQLSSEVANQTTDLVTAT
jgi:hypothetical protein